MPADISQYLALIPRANRSQPKFLATVSAIVQPLADIAAVAAELPAAFDLDNAVGVQLDAVGEWVGQSRQISIPLTGVYFALDTAGLGFDEGAWLGPYDPITGMVSLPDEQYRTLLRAKIAANHWDGTIPSAYEFLGPVFPGMTPYIEDNGDMSMFYGLIGPTPDAVTLALWRGGYLSVKPAGVRIAGYVLSSVPGDPVFGFDADNDTIGGFDSGVWANITTG